MDAVRLKRLQYIIVMMGARERFISSIEYLRRMGFLGDYSNMTSEEIFEEISRNDILLKDLEKKEEKWARKSDFEVDMYILVSDKKRVWGRDTEIDPNPGVATEIFNEIVEISKEVFQPTDVEEEWLGWGARIHFNFMGKRHTVNFPFYVDYLDINQVMREINSLIKDTGYQYYKILDHGQFVFAVMLTKEEAGKLIRERGWKLSCEWK